MKPETGNRKPEGGQFPCIDGALAAGAVLSMFAVNYPAPGFAAHLYVGGEMTPMKSDSCPTTAEALADLEAKLTAEAVEANLK